MSKGKSASSSDAYAPLKSVALAVLVVFTLTMIGIGLALCLGWVWPAGAATSILLGILGSLVASVVVTLVFTLISEQDFAQFVADSASAKAVDEVLKLVSMVPETVYEASSAPDRRFEERFNQNLQESSFYYFFSATADYCAQRLTAMAKTSLLSEKRIRILVLDPTNDSLLKAHARKRLPLIQEDASEELAEEIRKIREQILKTVSRLHPLAQRFDIDLRFHDCFVFFRSEIFDQGLFLTFQKEHETFPGSVYYQRSSPVYRAYAKHHRHYQELPARFSLRNVVGTGRPLKEVIDGLRSAHVEVK